MDARNPTAASEGEGPAERKRSAPIQESVGDPAKRIRKTNSVNHGLWGWERVLRRVIIKSTGTELTSHEVNLAIRNMEYIHSSGEACKDLVAKVLDYLVAEGLAEEMHGSPTGVKRRGPPVRICRWKTWEEIQSHPAIEVLLSRLGLREGDFHRLPSSAQAAGA